MTARRAARTRTPRFYFSLRSPYSWLAWRQLVGHCPDIADAVEWRPFFEPDETSEKLLAELGGTFPYTPMSRAKHLYILQDVGRLAAARGLTVRWPVDREPVWEVPHLAYLVAERAGRGREFVAAAYRSRWEEGRDICDRATMAELGGELGLDPAALAGASDDPELRAEGARALKDVCDDGVFGVPFFTHRRSRFWGLDRLEGFVSQVRGGNEPLPSTPAPSAYAAGAFGPTENGHAGGCG